MPSGTLLNEFDIIEEDPRSTKHLHNPDAMVSGVAEEPTSRMAIDRNRDGGEP